MKKAKILIIEDESIIAMDIRNSLMAKGYEICTIGNSAEDAVRIASTEKPDLIIMDIILKGDKDGIAAAGEIKKIHSAPVIYLTAHSDTVTLQKAKETAPQGYILKPLSRSELHLTVELALYKHEMEMKLKNSEERYRTLFEQAGENVVILEMGKEGIPFIADINESGLMAHGYTREEILGQPITFISPDISPEEVMKKMASAGMGKPLIFKTSHRRKDGSFFHLEVNARPIMIDGKQFFISVERDITIQKSAEDALRLSEEKYRILFQNNPVPMWVYDTESLAFLAVNDFAVDHYGYSADEFLKMTIKEIRPAEDIPRLMDVLSSDMGNIRKVGIARHRKKDDSIITVDIKGHKIDFDGRPAMLVLALDVTDQKKSEEQIRASLMEKEILLTEIHHRVKNNMQVIISLLNLQLGNIKDEKAREHFMMAESRIRSMALVHEQLYQSDNMAAINIAEYFNTLLSNFFESRSSSENNVTYSINPGNICLGLDRAIPCGLIVTELISNSYKHAFHNVSGGEIIIDMKKNRGTYTLSVMDNGIGMESGRDKADSSSLGLHLVDALVKQIRGTITISGDSGTTITVTFQE